jgi:2-polyprenyl-3-methyl-5-hydroxy-6-metoxy-1,4-benzoquinol methylase
MSIYNNAVKKHFDKFAPKREYYQQLNHYYHQSLRELCAFFIPKSSVVLQLGSGTGDLLAYLRPKKGFGIDISGAMIKIAQKKHPALQFKQGDVQTSTFNSKFEYIILTDLIGHLGDVQKTFENIKKMSNADTRIIITYYNFLWEPLVVLAEKLGLKMPNPIQNWLSLTDIQNLLFLADLEVVKKGNYLLLPIYIPIISTLVNKYVSRLPIIKQLCLVQYVVARVRPTKSAQNLKVSIIIPARNEAGNIEAAVKRTPRLGKWDELIFVEGNSSDDTKKEIKRVIQKYQKERNLVLIDQGRGRGKGDAVRKGFAKARGDILMILDADLTMPPEELPKYYKIISSGIGEFVMGSRLVYPMENQAMRFLNIIGNKFFSLVFSFLLDQKIKDTLCGTKVLFKKHYEQIVKNRSYFGDFDPFGDFDLIFGAAKLNLKIVEVPIRYKARTYGETNISRFKHGFLLLKMVIFASRKIKFV